MRLPIPMQDKGTKINEAEIKQYTAGVIADTQKIAEGGDSYRAQATFVAGCLEKLGDLAGSDIRAATGQMPYKSAEFLITKIITKDKDDAVEGLYVCPRCGTEILAESDPDHFTADRISDLKVTETEDMDFSYGLKNNVKLPAQDEEITEIVGVTMDFPTLNQCSVALTKNGRSDKVRLQLAIYVEALKAVNGREIDRKWKNKWGMVVFERMSTDDLKAIGQKMNEFGLQTELTKQCLKCGKSFKVPINTSNFFESSLA